MKRIKQTKEERELIKKTQELHEEDNRPVSKEDLEALMEHFGTNKNLPK